MESTSKRIQMLQLFFKNNYYFEQIISMGITYPNMLQRTK